MRCAPQAAAAGLGGSWIALDWQRDLGTGNRSRRYRVPWNWTTLKNMNNAPVATSFDDLTDGTIAAPINRTATNTFLRQPLLGRGGSAMEQPVDTLSGWLRYTVDKFRGGE
jgi:hypothetical protein